MPSELEKLKKSLDYFFDDKKAEKDGRDRPSSCKPN